MKRALIIYILLAGLLILAIGACTPPPENPKDDEPIVETDPIPPIEEEEPIEEEGLGKGPGETTTLMGENGETSTGSDAVSPGTDSGDQSRSSGAWAGRS